MKKIVAVLALLLSSTTLADTPKASLEQAAAFTEEEKREALKALQEIANGFGAAPAQAAPAPAAPQEPKKTMADVADKALDISTKYIGQVAGLLEKAAPRVWRVMIMQQYAKAAGQLVAPWTALLVLILYSVVARRRWKLDDDDKEDDFFSDNSFLTQRGARGALTFFLPLLAGVIVASIAIDRLADSAMYLINPEYYAIKDLVQLLLKPGSL